MQNSIRHIFLAGLSMVCISIMYFLLLVMRAPMPVILAVVAAGIILLFTWFKKAVPAITTPERHTELYTVIVIAGLTWLGHDIYLFSDRHGGWDAWAIWNYHARFLSDSAHWQMMFVNHGNDHPDYPLCLPSFFGFLIRLCSGRGYMFIPFAFSVFITIAIVAILFSALAKKNLLIAAIVLYLIVTDTFFVHTGISQYADTPLAFFLLCALISLDQSVAHKKYIIISAAFLGCCAWTKNEGAILALVFLAFNAIVFFDKKNIRYTFTGLVLPLLALLVFKLCYAPPNDITSGFTTKTLSQAFDAASYRLIFNTFKDNLHDKFHYMEILFFIYLALCMLRRKRPSLHFVMLIFCLLVYLSFYIFSSHDLQWHLNTSLDR